jgi:hypothetical protein
MDTTSPTKEPPPVSPPPTKEPPTTPPPTKPNAAEATPPPSKPRAESAATGSTVEGREGNRELAGSKRKSTDETKAKGDDSGDELEVVSVKKSTIKKSASKKKVASLTMKDIFDFIDDQGGSAFASNGLPCIIKLKPLGRKKSEVWKLFREMEVPVFKEVERPGRNSHSLTFKFGVTASKK